LATLTLDAQIADSTAKAVGNVGILKRLAAIMVDFDPRFEIMPGTKAWTADTDAFVETGVPACRTRATPIRPCRASRSPSRERPRDGPTRVHDRGSTTAASVAVAGSFRLGASPAAPGSRPLPAALLLFARCALWRNATRQRSNVPGEAPDRPAVVRSSLYLPEPVYEALRRIAFDERAKIHDMAMEGIDAVLRRRRLPTVDALKTAKKR
jgi:hypothetical protein